MAINNINNNDDFYSPFDAMSFSYDRCFLCGHELVKEKTIEHVFPKWLQKEFALANQQIYLLNRTTITYKQLTIPCCEQCNTRYLANIENTIKQYYYKGFSEFINLDKLVIFQWIAKIFYGLLFKELSLYINRCEPKQGFITEPELLKELRTLHTFLQSIRIPFDFSDFHPWSIFIVETRRYGDKRDFDYHDDLFNLTFSIRLGEIGIIACLEDNGAQEELFSTFFNKFDGVKLYYTQFDELVAKVSYKRSLMNRIPKYFMSFPKSEGQEVAVYALPLQGLSDKPIFDEWNQLEYAKYLAFQWHKYGIQFEDVFKEPNMVLSMLFNEDGTVKILDSKGIVIKDT